MQQLPLWRKEEEKDTPKRILKLPHAKAVRLLTVLGYKVCCISQRINFYNEPIIHIMNKTSLTLDPYIVPEHKDFTKKWMGEFWYGEIVEEMCCLLSV